MTLPVLEQVREAVKTALNAATTESGKPLNLIVTAPKREGIQPVNKTCVVAIQSDEPIEAAQNIARRKATFKIVVWTDFSELLEPIQDAETALIDLSARIQVAILPNELASHLGGIAEGTWVGEVAFTSDADFYVIETEITVHYRTLYFDPYTQG